MNKLSLKYHVFVDTGLLDNLILTIIVYHHQVNFTADKTARIFGGCAVGTAFPLRAITASVAEFPSPSGTAANPEDKHQQILSCLLLH
jgi:hypothetical protein